MINVGDIVKIKTDLFGTETSDDKAYGTLGYLGLFRHLEFEVTELVNDGYRGPMAKATITNIDELKEHIPKLKKATVTGSTMLLISDLEPALTKHVIAYEVIRSSAAPRLLSQGEKDVRIQRLLADRRRMKGEGLASSNKTMKDNWNELEILRGNRPELPPPKSHNDKVRVVLAKQRIELSLTEAELPTDEKSQKAFNTRLLREIKARRAKSKVITTQAFTKLGEVGFPVNKIGGTFTEPGQLLKAFEETVKNGLDTMKKPLDTKGNYIGIEIEFIHRGTKENLKKLLIRERLYKCVTLVEDASVRPCHNVTNFRGQELTILAKREELPSILARIDKVLSDPTVGAYTNGSCSLHVHLDCRSRNVDLVFKNLVRVQDVLVAAHPVHRALNFHSRRTESEKIPKITLEEHEKMKARDRSFRYWVVNGYAFAKYKTIEIRIGEGTVEPDQILNWVDFLSSIADHAKEIPSENGMKLASDMVTKQGVAISPDVVKYIDKRITRFNTLEALDV